MTWANAITSLRLIAAPLCAWSLVELHTTAAAWLFALAVLTDLIDGPIARHLGETSAFGALFDHATDAFFVTFTLAALAWRGDVPGVLPLLVAIAFVQYVVDSHAHIGRELRASRLGRWNGIAYFVLAGVPIVRDAFATGAPGPAWVMGAGWVLVVSTAVSMLDRLTARRRAA